jgi:Leucine-rich repeat (LRR) protein
MEPPAPPPKTPEEIFSEFQALEPHLKTDEKLKEAAQLPEELRLRLTSLNLEHSPVSDTGLKSLSAFPNLQSLNLNFTHISNVGLDVLPSLKKLETVSLDSDNVGGDGMVYVAQLTALRQLSMQNAALDDRSLLKLKDLHALEVLKIDGNPNLYGRELAQVIDEEAFPELKELSANGTKIGFYGLETAKKLEKLEIFRGADCQLRDEALLALAKAPNLRILIVPNNPISSLALRDVGKLKKIEDVNIEECAGVNDIAFNFLKNAETLRTLEINGTGCTLPAVQLLKAKFLKYTIIRFNGMEY